MDGLKCLPLPVHSPLAALFLFYCKCDGVCCCSFSRELLAPLPRGGDAGVWVVMDFWWTFECDKHHWEILRVECAVPRGERCQ